MNSRQDEAEGKGIPKKRTNKFSPPKWKHYKVIPEWEAAEVDDESVDFRGNWVESSLSSLCLLKHQKKASSKHRKYEFDILRFTKYQEVKYRLFAAQRLEAIRHGAVKAKEPIEDEDILHEMISMYGEMDQTSERFKKLFENFKEGYLEQLEECRVSENYKMYLVLKSGNPLVDHHFDCTSKIKDEINWKFSKSEIIAFENLSPQTNESKSDWLNLPRPYNQWELKTLEDLTNLPSSDNETNPLNLHLLDPKYYHFPRWTKVDDNYRMQAGICRSLNTLIHEFPCGITPDMFWIQFYRKFHYRINMKENSYGFRSLSEIFTSLSDVFYIAKDEQIGEILFPASFQGQIPPMTTIRTRITHLILQVLSMSEGFMLIDHVLEKLLELAGVKFNWFDWGFNSAKEFVESYVRCIEDSVTIQSLRVEEERQEIMEYYLVINSPFYMDTFNMIKANTEKVGKISSGILNRTRIQNVYLGYYDVMKNVADHIHPGDTFRCVISGVINPFRFHVVLLENWNMLEHFQSYVQETRWREKENPSEKEVERNLVVGLFVLCYTVKTGEEMEWFRGRIMERLPEQKYRVRLVDYGTEVNEPLKNIRYLHKDLAAEELTQAVLCQLRMPVRFEKYRKPPYWTSEHKRIFQDMFKKGCAVAKFHSSSLDKRTEAMRWEVSLSIVEYKSEKMIFPNVAQAFEAALLEKGLETGAASVFKEITLVWATAGK